MQIDHYAERVEVVWRSCLLMPDKTLDYSITWAEKLAKRRMRRPKAMFEKKVAVLKHWLISMDLIIIWIKPIHTILNAARLASS